MCFWTRREGRNQLSSKTVFSHLLSVLKNRPRSTEQGGLVGDDDWLAGCQFQVQFTGPHRTSTSAVVSCSSCGSIKDAIGSVSRPPRNEIWAAQSWGPREFPVPSVQRPGSGQATPSDLCSTLSHIMSLCTISRRHAIKERGPVSMPTLVNAAAAP